MRTIAGVFLLVLILTLSLGCASSDRRTSFDYNHDQLWKQGFGFGNPNPDRLRAGLEPVNFDGSTDKERIGDIAGDLLGQAIGKIGQSLWDSIRR